ncbi:FKBP-type peptidyl-prolyl cis-trans isomerase, partial [Acinetobacter baumannii]|nr:FKBP-type peptidyl-prolyl cis-trans isomerase [Acinetobacter baumannii]
ALWFGLNWYNGELSQWIRVAEVVGLCVIGVIAYLIGLLLTGLQTMKEGGKTRFFIPAKLAYGEVGAGDSIGPNSTLIFDIEL